MGFTAEEMDRLREIMLASSLREVNYDTVDHERVSDVGLLLEAMENIFDMHGLTVSTLLHEPMPNDGAIEIVGKEIVIKNPQLFVQACRLSSAIDIISHTDGTVEFDFGFSDLMKAEAKE